MKAIYLFAIGLFFLQSCSMSKTTGEESVSNEETAEKQVEKTDEPTTFIIGEGGGFTGKYIMYRLSSTGKTELYDEENDTYKEIGNVDKTKTKEIFEELAELNLLDYEYYMPGNMNYRITISGEDRTNNITWSDSRSPDDKVLFFYKKVMNEIRSLN
jgi:hypothetical protein